LRTLEGRDKNNKKFPKYTKAYADEKGVSRDSVDLFLEGDLLDELSLLNHKSGELVIGYEKGADINGKAEGNILGTYGQTEPIKGKQRDFLGITKSDLKTVIDTIDQEDVTLTKADIDRIARDAARSILGIEFDED
jgi:hypothetical protein